MYAFLYSLTTIRTPNVLCSVKRNNAELINTTSPFSDSSIPMLISNRKHIVELFNFFPSKTTIEVSIFVSFPYDSISISNHNMIHNSHTALLYRFGNVRCTYCCTIQYSPFSCFVRSFYVCFNSQNEQISICYSNKSSSYFDCEAKVHEMIINYVCRRRRRKKTADGCHIELNWNQIQTKMKTENMISVIVSF